MGQLTLPQTMHAPLGTDSSYRSQQLGGLSLFARIHAQLLETINIAYGQTFGT